MVALAVLMPIVASMGGNAGTQTMAVAVRAIATKDLTTANFLRVLWKEVLVGGFNGVVFALLIGVAAAAWYDNIALGIVIAAAMIINMLVAGLFRPRDPGGAVAAEDRPGDGSRRGAHHRHGRDRLPRLPRPGRAAAGVTARLSPPKIPRRRLYPGASSAIYNPV